jgi:4-hydroxy-tetrahydrodipicolinate synthase
VSFNAPRGVVAPILTPFNDDLSIATDLYVDLANRLLEEGCAGFAPFGTTGEALSVGIDERIDGIRSLIDGGIDPSLLIPGTGLTDVADTARLSRACLDLGCQAVMTLPPFYYKGVSEDGLYRYFEQLIDAIGDEARIFLYHIPPIAVVGIPPTLVARLHADFPEQIVGIKDSSNDWDNTRRLFDIDGLIVYPGSELPLIDALELGGPGCISATANVNMAAISKVVSLYDAGDMDAAREQQASIAKVRLTIQDYAPIPAQKRLLAMQTGDERWTNVRPPLDALSEAKGRELADALRGE